MTGGHVCIYLVLDYNLETVGPPAGGVILLHMLKILEGYNFTVDDADSDLMYHRVVEVSLYSVMSCLCAVRSFTMSTTETTVCVYCYLQ